MCDPSQRGEALPHEVVADLEYRFLELRGVRTGGDFDIHRCLAEFFPEVGIGDEFPRLFSPVSGAFRNATKRVIHDPVQSPEKRIDILLAASVAAAQGIISGANCHVDQEITVNGRFAKADIEPPLRGDGLQKRVG